MRGHTVAGVPPQSMMTTTPVDSPSASNRSFRSSVDVNPGFLRWLLLVLAIGAGPVRPSIAQRNAALGENGTLQFFDSLGIAPIR